MTPPETRARRRWWVIGSLGVLAMTAMAVWFGISATSGKVDWVNTGFEVVDEQEVRVRFDLRRDPSRPVTCVLEAQDERHGVIGRTEVTVGPTESSPSRQIGSVRTAAPAVTGYVDTCRYVGP